MAEKYDIRPGQSVELLQELHILTRDGKLNQDSRRKLKQVYHLYNFIEPLLTDRPRRIALLKLCLGYAVAMVITVLLADSVSEQAWSRMQALDPRRPDLPAQMELLLPALEEPGMYYIIEESPVVSGDELVDAQPSFDQNGSPAVSFRFDTTGARKFGDYTANNIGQPFAGRFIVWESSGSSGEPGLFVQDGAAMAVYDALEGLRRPPLQPLRRWLDPWCLAERIAFVGATSGHFASTVTLRRLERLQPGFAQRACAHDFLQPLPALVAALNAQSPSVLATYPSAALLLAGEARAGRLRVTLAEVWTGGETLGPAARAEIQAFGCPLANSYGASEFLALASECAHGALHLNADWVLLEPVDAQGRPVPPGTCGEKVWLTNLANHVQPLIRYELGDRVTLQAEPCACGSPLPVISVQGRSDDVLELRGARDERVRLLPLALTTILEEHGRVFDFQLVQTGTAALRLDLGAVHDAAATAAAREALRAWLGAQGLAAVRVSTRRVETWHSGRSGKRRRVVAAEAR